MTHVFSDHIQCVCPISYDMMDDPVMTSDGHTYEREAIESWLERKRASPLSNRDLDDPTVRPNIALRNVIRILREVDHPQVL